MTGGPLAIGSGVLAFDDFAFTPAVSAGILQLLEAGRISATGAMTNRPSWQADAAQLRAFAGRADLGLHLNLTVGEPLGRMTGLAPAGTLPRMDEMIRASLARSLPGAEIAAEIERQLDAFEQAMGAPPDFVDGHQHVHGLHGVREPLLDRLKATKGFSQVQSYNIGDTTGKDQTRAFTIGFTVDAMAGMESK